MSAKTPSKDEALEALDFIINVLREHEKDLDRLISELGKITEKLGEASELSGKIEDIEKRLASLQDGFSKLTSYMARFGESQKGIVQMQEQEIQPSLTRRGMLVLHCKHWEDFQTLARQAQMVFFLPKEMDKSFQLNAFKENQVITYRGELPISAAIIFKTWLSKQLDIPEAKIFEGLLSVE